MTFFLVVDHVFLILPIFFHIFNIFTVCYVIHVYDPFFTRKTPISENNSLITPLFTLFVLSRTSDKHYFSKYWGGRMHGPIPHQTFFGRTVPQSPLGLGPCLIQLLSQYPTMSH